MNDLADPAPLEPPPETPYPLPAVVRPSFTLFIILYGMALVLFIGIGIWADPESEQTTPAEAVVAWVFIATTVWALVLHMMYLYRAWSVIQDGSARTTPGKAVGFLFIPLFQAYWVFPCYYGLAEDYETFNRKHGFEDAPALPKPYFLVYAIFGCLAKVPCISALFLLPHIALVPFEVYFLCRAVSYYADRGYPDRSRPAAAPATDSEAMVGLQTRG
jgi:hypothetical protein